MHPALVRDGRRRAGLTRVGTISARKRLYAEGQASKFSGRREAERERRPADGVGYWQGGPRYLSIAERAGGARAAQFLPDHASGTGAARAVDRPD